MKTVTFQVYPDSGSNYRWRTIARNKKITATSGESFASKQSAERAVKAFAKSFDGRCKVCIHTVDCADVRGEVVHAKVIEPKV